MAITKPEQKTWLSAYQSVLFGITAENGFPFIFGSVSNINGKAQFTSSGNTYGTCPGKYFYTPTGTYAGVIHTIFSVNSNGDILTTTDFIDDDDRTDGTILPNFIFKVYHGYPTPTPFVNIRPVWVNGVLNVDIQQFLQSFFTIVPPEEGLDDNMFTHIYFRIIAAEDFADFLEANSLNEDDQIETMASYEWDDPDMLWYVINGVLPHNELNNDYADTGDALTLAPPIFHAGHKNIVSKIVNDAVYNFIIIP